MTQPIMLIGLNHTLNIENSMKDTTKKATTRHTDKIKLINIRLCDDANVIKAPKRNMSAISITGMYGGRDIKLLFIILPNICAIRSDSGTLDENDVEKVGFPG